MYIYIYIYIYICEQWFTGIYLDQKTQYEKICEQHLVVIFDDISIAYCFRGHVIIVNATLHYNTLLITIKKEDLTMLIDVMCATMRNYDVRCATMRNYEQLTSLSQLNKQSLALFTCSFNTGFSSLIYSASASFRFTVLVYPLSMISKSS